MQTAGAALHGPAGTVVGTLSAIDPDPGDTHPFPPVNDAGGRFALAGNELRGAGPLDFEANPNHTIRVRATAGCRWTKSHNSGVTAARSLPVCSLPEWGVAM